MAVVGLVYGSKVKYVLAKPFLVEGLYFDISFYNGTFSLDGLLN